MSTIKLCLSNSVLLNIYREHSVVKLWTMLGGLYQLKSLVNKLFLQKKLYYLIMEDNGTVIEHLDVYKTLVSQITFVGIKMVKEDKCITLLCPFPKSWDNLIVAICSASQKFDEIVSSILSQEMRLKTMDTQSMDSLSMIGFHQERNEK